MNPYRRQIDALITCSVVLAFACASVRAESPRQAPYALDAAFHGIGSTLPADFRVTSLAGKRLTLGTCREYRATVIALVNTSCPLVLKNLPKLAKYEQRAIDAGLAWAWVNTDAFETMDDMKAQVKRYKLQGSYIHDKDGRLQEALGALTTTDLFIVDRSLRLRYRGAVDDQYGIGYSHPKPRIHYAKNAVERILEGDEPLHLATWSPGCVLDDQAVIRRAGEQTEMAARPPVQPAKADPLPGKNLTYHGRIAGILQDHCVGCHRADGVAPFSLTSYEDVKDNDGMVAYMVRKELMPPWFGESDHLLFSNDRSLPAQDRVDLLAWLKSPMPVGEVRDAPAAAQYEDGWNIGRPDAVFELPRDVPVQAEGTMPYVNLHVELPFGEERWVKAIEIRPGNRSVVHHVIVTCREGRKRARSNGANEFFAAYVPGNSFTVYDEGFGKRLPANTTFRFQMHYTPNGTATADRTRIGLIFSDRKPRHEVMTLDLSNHKFLIPPGAARHPVQAGIRVPKPARLLAFFPHMHVRGTAFNFTHIPRGGGDPIELMRVPHYDFNWQLGYRLADPYRVAAGDRLEAMGWFDNSADNPANPDPTKSVRWGDQTDEEMMIGYIEYVAD